MQLTQQTDYAFKTMIYVASYPDRLVNISEIANYYTISRSHLTKVIAKLNKQGYLTSIRGNQGGLKLGQNPLNINLGQLVRDFEDFPLIECFSSTNQCQVTPQCRIKRIMQDALKSFLQVLDGYCLADIISNPALIGLVRGE
ncbi:Rrf2 family transcriptional regulator [Wohlfahrtiimonas chitiniclastica]|uniref:HTH-type transcriptional repressor NsrR n=2 Tax=Wohlfahrtiimonas chitiniclastica TaxID=400946 RepID=L8Y0Z6_9GAMM|nr:Rrf2 family transcriptional regulator [Wohlfahrtiimonas chitiniclastica]ELV08739.1 HTH-type transcriptional repressor NsrR [Wohlfahrtiimonas chitiniclastica SH04]KZS22401.1 transcriptional regulator [Wohlfahrtiimonas chitiniclastica]KZX37926.1 Rrf2 family transcriptional regulator [Wohlfahrtiimonas chitiniclastica]MBS7814001.1 Rrf2 family transcriptional regulator [Wohlfahrtiimonas chitiniclastica]MBS7816264.1 Rrf2 family transcriptional regulator [Wohlfahrtiimonas chitiniclastica]